MSAPNPQVVVTPDARADLTSIALYTAERWGDRQRDVYIERIVTAMYDLVRLPGRGRLSEDLGSGIRACAVEQHIVYYLASDREVTILRVLHSRMDASGQFEQ
jgi:toxin ParE1/3/4